MGPKTGSYLKRFLGISLVFVGCCFSEASAQDQGSKVPPAATSTLVLSKRVGKHVTVQLAPIEMDPEDVKYYYEAEKMIKDFTQDDSQTVKEIELPVGQYQVKWENDNGAQTKTLTIEPGGRDTIKLCGDPKITVQVICKRCDGKDFRANLSTLEGQRLEDTSGDASNSYWEFQVPVDNEDWLKGKVFRLIVRENVGNLFSREIFIREFGITTDLKKTNMNRWFYIPDAEQEPQIGIDATPTNFLRSDGIVLIVTLLTGLGAFIL